MAPGAHFVNLRENKLNPEFLRRTIARHTVHPNKRRGRCTRHKPEEANNGARALRTGHGAVCPPRTHRLNRGPQALTRFNSHPYMLPQHKLGPRVCPIQKGYNFFFLACKTREALGSNCTHLEWPYKQTRHEKIRGPIADCAI